MPFDLSANTRIHLAESLPVVDREKNTIISRIAANLARASGPGSGVPQDAAARTLVDYLIEQARAVVDTGRFARADAAAAAARPLVDAGYELPRVGDALVPILKDVLGAATTRQTVGAWSDTFWAVFGKERPRSDALTA